MDSDSDDDGNKGPNEKFDITGILFGNIDGKGNLLEDEFDQDFREHLGSLPKLGLNTMLNEVIEDVNDNKEIQGMSDFDALKAGLTDTCNDGDDENDGEIVKDVNAIDFSDITELSEDCAQLPPMAIDTDASKQMEDLEDAIPVNKVDTLAKDDKELMPPPAPKRAEQKPAANHTENRVETEPEKAEKQRKLDTPLADMLPSKYENVDVRELFPDFRHNKVLRFSRLFGPGKPSSLPQIWRHVKKKRRKRKQSIPDEKNGIANNGSDSHSDSEEPKKKGFGYFYAPDPTPDQCMSDDEDKFLSNTNKEDIKEEHQNGENGENKPRVADWRYGPAQIWYDMLDVPDSGEGFNYGFKVNAAAARAAEKQKQLANKDSNFEDESNLLPDDAFLMISQLHWEDEVVHDGNDIKKMVVQKLANKSNAAGWVPSSGSRNLGAFSQPGKTLPVPAPGGKLSGTASSNSKKNAQSQNVSIKPETVDDTWYSIFPVENEELIYSKWEDEILWDCDDFYKIPKPKVLTLDPNDENIILGIPDDIDPSKINANPGPPPKIKIPHPHVKKSKILLGKAGVINVLAEDTPPPPPKSPDRDPFNISDDSSYTTKTEPTLRLKVGGGNLIQHSTPVVELRAPFVPTNMGPMKLRSFHRPALRKYSHGSISSNEHHNVLPLIKHIMKKAKQREIEREKSGGGDVFFMRNPEDLSGKDGEIILAEFCEEHPPLMNQVGMCSKIKNYYKRKAAKDTGPQDYKYGEVAFAHTSPFLGIIHPGQCIQALENNMYRAPIYSHKVNPTDFLIIRTRNGYWIREIDALFTVGQQCPLYEVPGPNSKRANNFTRDFLQVFIYRLFWKSADNPRRIRMDDIKRAFPAHSESSIRKRLKLCADFKRTGMDSNWWVIKPEFRLPSEEEIRAMVSPEQCCAYFSMIAAEQRLKDAGYGEKFLFAPQEDDDEESQLKLDDEVKVAPWNTTRAYIQAMRGKCLLQLTGPADPTGCGEGFSYVRVPNKPTQTKEEQESQPKRTVTGTDADLRRLPLQRAKELLRKFKVPEEEIKKLSRWEVIDVVRTLSTEKAKAGEQGMDKFSRGNRFSIAEHQERYKEECQRIFDLQNRVLASSEILSTDEDESSASEESDLEELGKNLENMLANKKTSTQLSMEREELERQELLKKIMDGEEGDQKGNKNKDSKEETALQQVTNLNQKRILKITRTFRDSEGKEYTRVEIVRRQPVIDAYVKIRSSKDEAFIKQFATMDEQQKEEMKREKRRIQEQLRRIKRNQERERLAQLAQTQKLQPGGVPTSLGDPKTHGGGSHKERDTSHKEVSPSRKKFKLKPDLKLKCGACGQVGHMRTNKACPLYTGSQASAPTTNHTITEETEDEPEPKINIEEDDLVNVDGTKLTLSSKVLKRAEDAKRRSLTLKVPKELGSKRKRRLVGDSHCDYLRHNKTANRRRTDPVVVLSSILEEILNKMRALPDISPFIFPVNLKMVPDYHAVIQKPMDLQTMRENVRQRRYRSREEFLADLNQISENSTLYNGPNSTLTEAATRMIQYCLDLMSEKEDKIIRLEKVINPLLDDNDQVSLSYIFNKTLAMAKALPDAWPFFKPVNRKTFKDYYIKIKNPIDLETIGKRVDAHRYHSRNEFLSDFELLVSNCEQYNGKESSYTEKARSILNCVRTELENMAATCIGLEKSITKVQERAQEEMDWSGPDDKDYDFHREKSSSPENEFVDVEGNERPPSVNSRGLLSPASVSSNPQFDIKRGRGRPRKSKHDTVEEVRSTPTSVTIGRKRGRPRKDKLVKNKDNSHNSLLEEDLLCSTDEDEEDEFAEVTQDDNLASNNSYQGERSIKADDNAEHMPQYAMDASNIKTEYQKNEIQMGYAQMPGADDSQQVAEAMVQLSGAGFYTQQQQAEDSIDLDPNYDPSEFLNMHKSQEQQPYSLNAIDDDMPSTSQVAVQRMLEEKRNSEMTSQRAYEDTRIDHLAIAEDLEISESEDESDGDGDIVVKNEPLPMSQDFAEHENMQTMQQQQVQQQLPQQPPPQEQQSTNMIDIEKEEPADDNDDDGWLRF